LLPSSSIIQVEIHLHGYLNIHRLPVPFSGFKSPSLDCVDCLRIESDAQGAENVNLLRKSIFVDY